MIKVKVTFPYLDWPLKRQTPNNSGQWGNYKFFINENIEECDYWVVYNFLLKKKETAICNHNNIFFFTAEPASVQKYQPRFLRQFSHVITSQNKINHPGKCLLTQGLPWFINKSYDELINIDTVKKTKKISLIISNKQFTPGHKKRYEFALDLKKYFGNEVDLYGRGINDFDDKWDVLAPYQYSIAIENFSCNHYFSEKISDCYLSHTFPLYYGCPNLNEYFDEKSFLRININDIESSKRTIEKILNDTTHYKNHLNYVLEAKKKYLDYYNLFPLIENFIKTKKINANLPKEQVTLYQKFYDPLSLAHSASEKIRRTIMKL